MAKTVAIDKLAEEVASAVRAYTEGAGRAIEIEVDETADAILGEVRQLAPKQTGEYARGFAKVKRRRGGGVENVIWNPKHYRRVHLLEKGHAKRGGGRVEGTPHVGPAVDKYAPRMVRRIAKILKDGG